MSSATTSGPDTMRLARDERAALAEFLSDLTPDQWDAPTPCTLWRVRDVVAHIYSYEDLGLLALVPRFAAGRFDGDRVNELGGRRLRRPHRTRAAGPRGSTGDRAG